MMPEDVCSHVACWIGWNAIKSKLDEVGLSDANSGSLHTFYLKLRHEHKSKGKRLPIGTVLQFLVERRAAMQGA